MTAGWRSERRTERRAIQRTCPSRPPTPLTRPPGRRGPPRRPRRGVRGGAGPLERAAGLGQEDVVERRRVELEAGDRDALGVERAHDLGELLGAAVERHRDALRRGRGGRPEAAEHAGQAVALAGVGRDRLDARPAHLGLERGGGALGDEVAVVDDADAVGEDVGLLEVLGRQEDGDPVVLGQAGDLLPQRGAALGSRPVVGSSRKRIPGRWTSASARSSRRFMPPE
jgi:hypothetical protein